jgi:hypothetical protein
MPVFHFWPLERNRAILAFCVPRDCLILVNIFTTAVVNVSMREPTPEKTACVALSEQQASHMTQAIENHKKLEEVVREMREITQTLILETIPGVRRRKPISEIPKAR